MERYEAMLDKNVVGSVEVTQEGLYSRFQCRCTLPDSALYKLVVFCNEQSVELGVCVPQGESFYVDTKIARKKLGEGTLRFSILPIHASSNGLFVAVRPEEPFAYLQMLDGAHAQMRGDSFGVVIPQAGSV